MSHIGVKRLFFVAALLCVATVPSVAAGCPFVHAKRSSADGTLEQQFLAAHGRSASVEELAARTVPESDASGDARGDASDQWEGQIPMASNTSDPLVVFNNLFHTVYSNVGVDVRPDPVILVVRGLCTVCVCVWLCVCGCVAVCVCVCVCVAVAVAVCVLLCAIQSSSGAGCRRTTTWCCATPPVASLSRSLLRCTTT